MPATGVEEETAAVEVGVPLVPAAGDDEEEAPAGTETDMVANA